MDEQNRFRCATAKRQPVIWTLLYLFAFFSGTAFGQSDVEDLQRQLRERDAEILKLRKQLDDLTSGTRALTPASGGPVGTGAQDEELEGALESSLVRQGGRVLPSGTFEIEPEVSYLYDEPSGGARRDRYSAALTARIGLRGAVQADIHAPYVIQDRWTGLGTSSGVGDASIGLTKEVVRERDAFPAVLAYAQWRLRTGDINKNPPTGFGQDALQIGVTLVKRKDPVVLFGTVSYTDNFGNAHLNNGSTVEARNLFGARLGLNLAATPDLSLYSAVSLNAGAADRFNGQPVESTDRLIGMLELGGTTVIARGRFLNVGTAFGFTPAAPRFSAFVSLPVRF